MEIDDTLPQMAIEASRNAYVPYSGFKVGAAVITEDGSIYTGCNIEDGSYGLTMCAERTAIYKAISGGARKIKAIAIAGGEKTPAYPCGACRQVMLETQARFGDAMRILLYGNHGIYELQHVGDLLPLSFSAATME